MTEQASPNPDATGFFQRPAFNAFERLVCSHLIEASKNEPLLTVIHIARASLALSDESLKSLGIDKVKMLSLYTVSERLYAAIPFKYQGEVPKYSVNLSTLDFDVDVNTWLKMGCYEYSVSSYSSAATKLQQLKESKNKIGYFHEANRTLTVAGYKHMVSDFLLYSIPLIEDATRRLTVLVSPETYTEMIRLYHGEKAEAS